MEYSKDTIKVKKMIKKLFDFIDKRLPDIPTKILIPLTF